MRASFSVQCNQHLCAQFLWYMQAIPLHRNGTETGVLTPAETLQLSMELFQSKWQYMTSHLRMQPVGCAQRPLQMILDDSLGQGACCRLFLLFSRAFPRATLSSCLNLSSSQISSENQLQLVRSNTVGSQSTEVAIPSPSIYFVEIYTSASFQGWAIMGVNDVADLPHAYINITWPNYSSIQLLSPKKKQLSI